MKNLDDIFPKEFVARRKKQYELKEISDKKKASYWDFLGELMFYGGYEAVRAVLNDEIELTQARTLLLGCRRVQNGITYDNANAALAGAAGVHKGSLFDRIMDSYKKDMI